MFKSLPRQTFGRLQSKLFPLYFGLSTATSAVLLGTLCFAGAAPPRQALTTLGKLQSADGQLGGTLTAVLRLHVWKGCGR